MPSAIAYRRAPLVDPAFVPLADAAVHTEGLQQSLTEHALKWVDLNRMSALDAVLATKLGGYTQAPPVPDVEGAAQKLAEKPGHFVETVRAASMIASMNRDKDAMLRVLAAMRALLEKLPSMSEEALFGIGADVLRSAVDLYRRTGQRFLLELLENLRSRLPDVSGVMHMFPFQRAFQPEQGQYSAQEKEYYDRMQRFATGKLTADVLAMTALLAQYSGSGRDAAAAKTGLAALMRYHGMPNGTFSSDPFLAGRDPARAVELQAVGAQAEAYLDALCMDGDVLMAEKLEMLLINVLPDLLTEKGLRTLAPTNRLSDDDSCAALETAEPEDVSALLRALYAIRRAVWLSRDDETIAYMLPVSGGCLTRLGGVPVRFTARVRGVFQKEIQIRVECRQSVNCTLKMRIPAYADGAQLSVNGEKPQAVNQGGMAAIRRTFHNGDIVTLVLSLSPRMESGYRGSASVYVGAQLMALALPDANAGWRYAAVKSLPITSVEDAGVPYALITACEAPEWREKAGFILPPPQDVPAGPAYELTLIPAAGTDGRIAAFPCVRER